MTTTDNQPTTDGSQTPGRDAPDIQVFRVYIEAPAERVWEAIAAHRAHAHARLHRRPEHGA